MVDNKYKHRVALVDAGPENESAEVQKAVDLIGGHDFDLLAQDVVIFVGPEADPADYPEVDPRQKKKVIFGKCLCQQRHCGEYVRGCPPTEFEAADTGLLVSGLESLIRR